MQIILLFGNLGMNSFMMCSHIGPLMCGSYSSIESFMMYFASVMLLIVFIG